ncbi:MAG: hypothetical protein GQ559_07065 [Desulfobulbaceae bacterium]|nr:hypothetical protein [Desulfobulbaceae bacterium]
MKPTCLSCKYYRVADSLSGTCQVLARETGDKNAERPMVRADDSCEKWIDSGQQYYVRLGWIKSQKEKTASQ